MSKEIARGFAYQPNEPTPDKPSDILVGISFGGVNYIDVEDYKKLQAKVNQLETNRDKAIEYIKHSWWLRTDQTYDTSKDLQGWEVEELLSLLERGKE
jgi:hypothetical protein